MNENKASKAMEYLDEKLIIAAMDDTDLKGKTKKTIEKGGIKMKKTLWIKWGSIAAALVFIICAVLITGSLVDSNSSTVIALDVNPSIELEINGKEEVKEVNALNSEAQTVLKDMDLKGVDLNVALNAIIGSMVNNGFLSVEQNSILVSIDSENGDKSTNLKTKLTEKIELLLADSNISASVITQDYDNNKEESDKAQKNNISVAKATLITKIVAAELLDANGVPYTFETLAKLKVNELKVILESKSLNVEGIISSGIASIGKYISAEEAVSAALEKASLNKADVIRLECEIDYDGDQRAMIYEIEFVYGGKKYEYEILASDGTVVEEEVEPAKDDDDEELVIPENVITRENILKTCYEIANVIAENVRRPKLEIEYENGVIVYNIEFKFEGYEFEFTFNAITGELLEQEKEPID